MESQTESLILGSGVAACTAALALAKEGIKVTLVAPNWNQQPIEAQSAAGIFYRGEGDSKELQCEDLKRLGGENTCPRALEHLVSEGTSSVDKWLVHELQLGFDRNEEGAWGYTFEEGHSLPRTIRVGENTSARILQSLKQKLQVFQNIEILTDVVPVELITLADHSTNVADLYKKPACLGVYLLDKRTHAIYPLLAKETIIASEGIHDLFASTEEDSFSGQGISLAARAGARLIQLQAIHEHRSGSLSHYFMNGGIAVDKFGQTSVMRLRAIGESACTGVHGDSFYPSVYLLESIVWANTTAQDMIKQLHKFAYYFPNIKPYTQGRELFSEVLLKNEWTTLRNVMKHYMAPKAGKESLRRAKAILEQQAFDLEPLFERASLTPQLVSLRHATETARMLAKALTATQ